MIIVGLGNPGSKYEHTRHNVGFDVLDIISEKLNIKISSNKFKSLIGEGFYNGKKVVLVKPQTFMNLSGEAVVALLNFYKINTEDLLVIFDDIDIEFASVRYRSSGSAGTHNGMKNIIALTGENNFPRIRVGVGKPQNSSNLADFVLSTYKTKEEREQIFNAYNLAADVAIEHINHDSSHIYSYLSAKQANKKEINE